MLVWVNLDRGTFPGNVATLNKGEFQTIHMALLYFKHGFKHPARVVESQGMLAKECWVVRAGPGWSPVWLGPWLTGCQFQVAPSCQTAPPPVLMYISAISLAFSSLLSLFFFILPIFLFSFLFCNSHQTHHGSKVTRAAITPPFGSCISPPSPCLCPFSSTALLRA